MLFRSLWLPPIVFGWIGGNHNYYLIDSLIPVFDRMAKLSRSLNVRLVKAKGQRVFLDELPPDAGDYPNEPEIQCGPFCEMAEKDIAQGCAA